MDMNPAGAETMRAIAAQARSAARARSKEAGRAGAAAARRSSRSGAEKALTPHQEEVRESWAARHPAAARAERGLRKGRADMLRRWDHKNDGTPETHEHASRRNQGALARLYESGAIDREQLAAAVEIAEVAARIGADVAVRTASLETRIDAGRRGDGSFYEKLGQVRREVAYTRWRSEARGPIAALLEMIVGEGGEPVGFTVVAKRYRMHNRRARALLIAALDLWPRILGHVRKEIDPAALAAAQAGIL